MWSGPRNLSTALMRSFENRKDTKVWDEPLYAYYLNETKKDHPLKEKIIKTYETNIDRLIEIISLNNNSKKIFYQKHMTHHVLDNTPLNWMNNGINCFLIRNPKDVLLSYIKKNNLENSNDIGFPMQLKLFNLVKKFQSKPIVINANDLSVNPKKILTLLCREINIPYNDDMLSWPKGNRESDGLWGKIWYKNVKSSTCFNKFKRYNLNIPSKYKPIYENCLKIYNEINSYNILNER
tara:strand:- start:1575 stop:2285 length:711 start_codon:yes stop_codon:yes gene_type:complete